ncbi:MAG: CAP domain-containing protein [Actinomycetota bacterium]
MRQARFVLNAVRTTGTALILALGLMFIQVSPAHASPALTATLERQILDFHNAERAARGIRSLVAEGRLQQAARRWAHKLANEGTIYHIDVLPARGLGFRAGGENIVYRVPSMTARYAHIEWMKSDLHRKNLLDPAFSHAGVGVSCATVGGRSFTVAVVEFGADRSPSTSVPPLDPRVIGDDQYSGEAVTCQGYAAPPAPAPLVAAPQSPARTAPPVPPALVPAPRSAPAPQPQIIPLPPPPGPAPAYVPPPAPPVPLAPPVVAVQVGLEQQHDEPADEPKDQKTAGAAEPRPIEMEPARPVAHNKAAAWSGGFFLVSLLSWLSTGMICTERIRRRQQGPPGLAGRAPAAGPRLRHLRATLLPGRPGL